jgi:hypothetical protein
MSMHRHVVTSPLRARAGRWLVALTLAAAALALAPPSADALSVGVAMPDSVTVGQTGLTAHLTLTNTNALPATICSVGECDSQGIILVGSCGAADTPGTCKTPDLGVFSFASTATIPLGSCGALVSGFTVAVADALQGTLRFTPLGGSVVLAPAQTCDISVAFGVLKQPAIDVDQAAGIQTWQSAAARAQVGVPPLLEDGTARVVRTVLPAPVVAPPPAVPPAVVPPPAIVPPPPAPADLDHFKCYEALQPNFRRRLVGTRDQFGQRRARVVRTRQLCNPVSKDGGRVHHPRAHLVCYETRDTGNRTPPRTVLVTNQFGQRRLTTGRPNRLCVPSLKRRTAGAVPTTPNPARLLDHFRCYDVVQQPAARAVKLADQFGTTTAKVVRVIRLCNPVRKNNEPVRRPKAHLVCYSVTDSPAFRPLAVRVRNQFGSAALRIRRPETLCLPSFKEVLSTTAPAAAPAGLDHFKCYEAEQPQLQPRFVGLRDQFGQSEGRVLATRQICNPVSKNHARTINPRAHLACYETPDAGIVPFQPRDVRVSNQFGIRPLSVVKPVTLCVPSLKRKGGGAAPTGANPTLVLDHFRCYDVKPVAAARTVKLADQFKTTKTKVVRVVRLCNPVRKNNEVVRRPQAHLVCYSISEAPFQPLAVTVRNQFGVAGLRVRRPQMLCLPSFKKLVTAAARAAGVMRPAGGRRQ